MHIIKWPAHKDYTRLPLLIKTYHKSCNIYKYTRIQDLNKSERATGKLLKQGPAAFESMLSVYYLFVITRVTSSERKIAKIIPEIQ